MGIWGFFSEIERLGYRPAKVNLMRGFKGAKIVVDGSSIIRLIEAKSGSNWSHNGDFQLIQHEVDRFVSVFEAAGISLVIVFDGGLGESTFDKWKIHREKDISTIQKFGKDVSVMERTCAPSTFDCIDDDSHFPSGNGKMALAEAFLRTGKCAAVINAIFDADVEAAAYCVQNKCFGVITGDSDFFPLQVPNVLRVTTLSYTAKSLEVSVYETRKICTVISIQQGFLPLASSLCGNDFVDRESLSGFHGKLKRKYKTGSVISAVSSLIKTSVSRGDLKGKTVNTWVAKNRDLLLVKTQVQTSLESYKLLSHKDAMLKLRPGAAALIETMEARGQEVKCMVPRFLYSILGSGICTNDALLEDSQSTAVWVAGRSLRRKIYAATARLSKVEKVGTFGVIECGIVVDSGAGGTKLPVLTVNADRDFPTDGFTEYPASKSLFYSFYGATEDEKAEAVTLMDVVMLSVGCVHKACPSLPVSTLKSLVYQAYILSSAEEDKSVPVPKKAAELFMRNVHAASLFVYFMELATCVDCLCGFSLGQALVHSKYFSGSLFHHFATSENKAVSEYIKDASVIEALDKRISKFLKV